MQEKIKLECTEGTGEFYTTSYNKKNRETGFKLKLKKFSRKLQKHVMFVEKKLK